MKKYSVEILITSLFNEMDKTKREAKKQTFFNYYDSIKRLEDKFRYKLLKTVNETKKSLKWYQSRMFPPGTVIKSG